jgi:hypothetical protein
MGFSGTTTKPLVPVSVRNSSWGVFVIGTVPALCSLNRTRKVWNCDASDTAASTVR